MKLRRKPKHWLSEGMHLGDCLKVMRNIEPGSVDMAMCDPPYGTTACKWDTVIDLAEMWAHLKRIVKPNGAIVLTASQPFTSRLVSSNYKMFRQALVWKKNIASNFLNANRMHMAKHEDVCVFYAKPPCFNKQMSAGRPYTMKRQGKDDSGDCYGNVSRRTDTINNGLRNPTTIVEVDVERGIHPTQKPVALFEYLIKTYTNEGDLVLDFTSGSGTTAVACQNLSRRFICIEMDEGYFNASVERVRVNA